MAYLLYCLCLSLWGVVGLFSIYISTVWNVLFLHPIWVLLCSMGTRQPSFSLLTGQSVRFRVQTSAFSPEGPAHLFHICTNFQLAWDGFGTVIVDSILLMQKIWWVLKLEGFHTEAHIIQSNPVRDHHCWILSKKYFTHCIVSLDFENLKLKVRINWSIWHLIFPSSTSKFFPLQWAP